MVHDSVITRPGYREAPSRAPAENTTSEAGAHLPYLVQGGYYLITGLWPLASIESFQAITGRKTDLWLVKTVGVLATVIGGVLSTAGMRRRVTPETDLLAGGSAAGFAGIDLVYVLARRISPVYLLDAAAEAALLVWLARRWGSR